MLSISDDDSKWAEMITFAIEHLHCSYCEATPGEHCQTTAKRSGSPGIHYDGSRAHWKRYEPLWRFYEKGYTDRQKEEDPK